MSFGHALLQWYDQNARDLPWRFAPSPYRVWVSEIMLQQTRVETVLPYFERFISNFPDLSSLASSSQQDVLTIWEGLGYYSRARNLHRAARVILTEHNGEFPQTANELEFLPGIGTYTAAAIASIAFQESVAAVDGNIKRVYARLLNLSLPFGSVLFEATIQDYAQSMLPPERPGDFNQALMDLGAIICRPRQPNCPACPVNQFCQAYQQGNQNNLPFRIKKPPLPHFKVCVAVIRSEGKVLLRQRAQTELLAGLWEYPGGKFTPADSSLEACLKREVLQKTSLEVSVGQKIGVFEHAYTHYKISVHVWYALLPYAPAQELPADLGWVTPAELPNYPMGKVARMISNLLIPKP